MIEQLYIVCIALLFLFIGYYLGSIRRDPLFQQKTIKTIKQTAMKAGIIEYPTQADIDYRESGEEKVDAARTKLFEESFKPHG